MYKRQLYDTVKQVYECIRRERETNERDREVNERGKQTDTHSLVPRGLLLSLHVVVFLLSFLNSSQLHVVVLFGTDPSQCIPFLSVTTRVHILLRCAVA